MVPSRFITKACSKKDHSKDGWQIIKRKGATQGATAGSSKPESGPYKFVEDKQPPQENTSNQVSPINTDKLTQETASNQDKDNVVNLDYPPSNEDVTIIVEETIQKSKPVDGKKDNTKDTSEHHSEEALEMAHHTTNTCNHDHLHLEENYSESLSDSEVLARKNSESSLDTNFIASRTRSLGITTLM
ncbi:hypothetical protein DM860_018010 [Cuscuta australis]|uniref:Uncharacterized protein n=1 Tax=Cuscuta australis TaxID=267555 RepID=A0A328D0B0_9ASTE|nr:hypothetical protein DM860_018010 [Cuscuta australis]